VTVGSDAVVGECMTVAGAFEPSGRRWALSAIRPSVSTAPTTKKYFKISIIPPQATPSRLSRARCLRGSFAAVCRYRDGPFSRAKGEVRAAFPGASEAVRAGPNLQNENPPGISPGGPRSLAPSLPPVHPRSEAWSRTRFYIGGNHEYSMTTVRKQRVRPDRLPPQARSGSPSPWTTDLPQATRRAYRG
jgi:hypothetical protein